MCVWGKGGLTTLYSSSCTCASVRNNLSAQFHNGAINSDTWEVLLRANSPLRKAPIGCQTKPLQVKKSALGDSKCEQKNTINSFWSANRRLTVWFFSLKWVNLSLKLHMSTLQFCPFYSLNDKLIKIIVGVKLLTLHTQPSPLSCPLHQPIHIYCMFRSPPDIQKKTI